MDEVHKTVELDNVIEISSWKRRVGRRKVCQRNRQLTGTVLASLPQNIAETDLTTSRYENSDTRWIGGEQDAVGTKEISAKVL